MFRSWNYIWLLKLSTVTFVFCEKAKTKEHKKQREDLLNHSIGIGSVLRQGVFAYS